MAKRIVCVSLAIVTAVAACAAPSQPFLDQARSDCGAGNQDACGHVAELQAQVNYEQQQQAEKVAAGILLGLSAAADGAAAGYAAAHPAPVYVTPVVICRWNCW